MAVVLVKPTVAELVAHLLTLPQDVPVSIEDADTQWTIHTIHVGVNEGTYGPAPGCNEVILWGEYPEMN